MRGVRVGLGRMGRGKRGRGKGGYSVSWRRRGGRVEGMLCRLGRFGLFFF